MDKPGIATYFLFAIFLTTVVGFIGFISWDQYESSKPPMDEVFKTKEIVFGIQKMELDFLNEQAIHNHSLELAYSFAENYGLDLRLEQFAEEDVLLQQLDRGKIDVALDINIPHANGEDFLSSEPFSVSDVVIIGTSDTEDFSRFEMEDNQLKVFPDLIGLSTLNELGDLVQSKQLRVNSFSLGQLDYVLHEINVGKKWFTVMSEKLYTSLVKHLYSNVTIVDRLDTSSISTWAVRNKKTNLLVVINDLFAKHQEQPSSSAALKVAEAQVFKRNLRNRLPEYIDVFVEVADKYGLPWQLAAAISYQESHWNPKAVSPTGVKGLMMLTSRTARELGVTDRVNVQQSIEGGTKYFVDLLERVPESVNPEDRIRFALAAYNVGMGHIYDARKITSMRGLSPDSWVNLRTSLPLLRKQEWHKHTRYGYARGNEPVLYVANIEKYFSLLRQYYIDNTESLALSEEELESSQKFADQLSQALSLRF